MHRLPARVHTPGTRTGSQGRLMGVVGATPCASKLAPVTLERVASKRERPSHCYVRKTKGVWGQACLVPEGGTASIERRIPPDIPRTSRFGDPRSPGGSPNPDRSGLVSQAWWCVHHELCRLRHPNRPYAVAPVPTLYTGGTGTGKPWCSDCAATVIHRSRTRRRAREPAHAMSNPDPIHGETHGGRRVSGAS
jgi:hypothetical protein